MNIGPFPKLAPNCHYIQPPRILVHFGHVFIFRKYNPKHSVHNRPFSKDKQSRFKVIPFFVSFYDCLLQDLLHLHLVLEPLTQTFNLLLLNVSIPKYRAAVMCWTIWKLLSDCNPKPSKVYLSHRYWPNRTRQRLFPLFSFLLFFLRYHQRYH